MKFLLPGTPRTKKTHNRIVKVRGRTLIIPSASHDSWLKAVLPHLKAQLMRIRSTDPAACPVTVPVNCCALIYREKAIGDAVGYFQAIADALEHAGAVENDRLIVSWDGSRLLKDAANPRVEVELSWP